MLRGHQLLPLLLLISPSLSGSGGTCVTTDDSSCMSGSADADAGRTSMLREIQEGAAAGETKSSAADKSVLIRGCDCNMAARASEFLPPLVGNPSVWESSTDDTDFIAKLAARSWDVVMFAPGACRFSAAGAPIPGGIARTEGWSLTEYRALVREAVPAAVIVETTEEREIVPKLRAALGL